MPKTALIARVHGDPDVERQMLLSRLLAIDATKAEVVTLLWVIRMQPYFLGIAFWLTVSLGGLALALTVSGFSARRACSSVMCTDEPSSGTCGTGLVLRGIAPACRSVSALAMTKARPERRAVDRPLKRMLQLQVRLEALLRDARTLRAEGTARTRNALALSAMLKRKRVSSR